MKPLSSNTRFSHPQKCARADRAADRHLNKPILVEQTKSVYPKLLSTSTLFPDAWRNHEQTFTSNETHIQTSIVGLECL